MDDHGDRPPGLVDAEQFLRVSDSLKQAFAQLSSAELPPGARERWQRRLLAITNLAKHDLDRAEAQTEAYRRDFEREQGQAPPPAEG